MTRAGSKIHLAVLLGVLALAAGAWPRAQAVQPPPAAPAQVAATGLISGQVVELPSGRPVPDVPVLMLGRGAPQPGTRGGVQQQRIVSDSQGRFYFSRLAIGIYYMSAQKRGYHQSRAAPYVEVSDAERLTDIRIRLIPTASLSGIVRDTVGDPVVATTMVGFRRSFENGKPSWQESGQAVTDDRGAYRMSDLRPGDYLVCACGREPIPFDAHLLTTLAAEPIGLLAVAGRALAVGADVVTLDNTVKTFAPRFHPAAASVARAITISLAPGDDKTGVDVALDFVRATRVSGRIVGAQSPVQASSVFLLPATDADRGIDPTNIPPMLVQADGRFDFAPVSPGQYELMVGHIETGATGGGPTGAALGFLGPRGAALAPIGVRAGGPAQVAEVLWAIEPLTVGESGVSGLVIQLNRSLTVRGRMQFVGAAPRPQARVNLSAINSTRTLLSGVGVVAQDGSFVVQNIGPGKYTVNVPPLPGYPTLKSVTLGGRDVTDLPLDVREKDLTELVITFSDAPMATLTLTTQMPPQAQVSDDLVAVAFPADRRLWPETFTAWRWFKDETMPPNGVVKLTNLPAGDYFVALINGLDMQNWPDPSWLELVSRHAQRVTLSDGGKQTVEIRR